jgi:hypothetical protein
MYLPVIRPYRLIFKLFVLVGLGWAAIELSDYWYHRPVFQPPGVLVGGNPVQNEIQGRPVIRVGAYNLTVMASFDIDARVLARRDYRGKPAGDLMPLDLALGWGQMSNSANLNHIRIRQSNIRTYGWRYEDSSLLPAIKHDDIHRQSANMHMIPASDAVAQTLLGFRVGQVIRIEGYLVNVSGPDGAWNTSLTRDDEGFGGCEIVYVKSAKLLNQGS